MPRKTDGIEFEIHPRPTKGEDGKPLLYVRPAKGRKKSFKQLEDFCNKYRNLRTGEFFACKATRVLCLQSDQKSSGRW